MSKLCDNKGFIDLILLIVRYIIPLFIVFIGLFKLLCIENKHKAFKRFVKYFLTALIICLCMFFVQIIFDKSISCNMDNILDNELEKNNENSDFTSSLEDSVNKENRFEVIDGVTYVDGVLIVNKTYSIPSNYAPAGASSYNSCNMCLTSETLDAFSAMQSDSSVLGLNIYISSGYRSYSYQEQLYNNYVSYDGKEQADTYSARPGHSEHQTGLAFDLNTIDDSFANTAEGKWIHDNCWKYGLILRYPLGKENITGYQYESWHLRYVGNDLAKVLYNDGNWITLEEYYNLTSEYSDV